MIHVPITLNSPNGTSRNLEPTRVSIPFASGILFNLDNLCLVNDLNKSLSFQPRPLSYWPNGSVKWLEVNFLYTSSSEASSTYLLTSDDSQPLSKAEPQITVKKEEQSLNVNTGEACFELSTNELGCFTTQSSAEQIISSQDNSIVLTDAAGVKYRPVIQKAELLPQTTDNTLTQTVSLRGQFQISSHQEQDPAPSKSNALNFEADLTFYANCAWVKTRFTVHNPQSMVHDGGKWDLGNEHSIFFQSLALSILQPTDSVDYQLKQADDIERAQSLPLKIWQASSGGENWQSTNHMNHQGEITLPFQGYQLTQGDKSQVTADRASPYIVAGDEQAKTSVYIENFWENFPTSVSVEQDKIAIELFPEQAEALYELQPGEKKSHNFFINYQAHKEDKSFYQFATAPVLAQICPEYLAQTQVLPLFATAEQDQALNNLVALGLTSSNNFIAKREVIDEYGWRNFGDLYADHEALEYKGDSELISHYNNQYDPLYGFLRQYLLTGEAQWLNLANDLAQHVKDIDIYHTELDRDEYNGGLFWHTDHYLPAETASHRTYSKRQTANAYQDHAGGGGPGGQHCYTTGLMLHYFLTGDESSKAAALTITNWVTKVYEGSNTFFDFLLGIKNKHRIDLKNLFTGQYPLDRGTGNYIVALLDSFELTGEQSYLDNASLVIKNTVHPNDDIIARDLGNVEECWFYTVFLQAVTRFLQLKETHQQVDESFQYAQQVLLNYTSWMLAHEAPYLDKPDILEYPNHTWAAQDIRKANLFFAAAYFAQNSAQQEQFIAKGEYFYQYVTQTLEKENTRDYTRILSILMQNHGAKSYYSQRIATQESFFIQEKQKFAQEEKSAKQHLRDAFFETLSNTSLSSELNWLRKRVAKVDHLLIKLGR